MPLRNKYSISDWVLSQDCIKEGDTIAFYCEDENKEVHAEVIGLPSTEYRQFLSCKRAGASYSEIINFYSTVVYKIREVEVAKTCSCGAKHTSNPRFHLSYCDLASSGASSISPFVNDEYAYGKGLIN